MIPRTLRHSVKDALAKYSVIGLLGSRQVGKTTLLNELKKNIHGEVVYYRTQAGAEVDFVLVPPQSVPIAIEIKRTLSPAVGRGFREAMEDLKANCGYFVYPGQEQFPLNKKVTALGSGHLNRIFE